VDQQKPIEHKFENQILDYQLSKGCGDIFELHNVIQVKDLKFFLLKKYLCPET
jgi:hypothetical protein